MTVFNVFMMTLSELFGNTHLKWFSENQDKYHLTMGLIAYMSVIFFLIRSFAGKSMMWTCVMWEAMIVIGGAIVAYFVFGEKFEHWVQWLGILLALGAAVCVNYECNTKDMGCYM